MFRGTSNAICGIAGIKCRISINVDNQRFILQKLRDFCGNLLEIAGFLREIFAHLSNKSTSSSLPVASAYCCFLPIMLPNH